VRILEVLIAALCVAFGIRSLVYWVRRPFEGDDVTDQVLFALFVTGRVGIWFAFAGLFLLYASIDTQNHAFVDGVQRFNWYVLPLLILAAMQFVSGFLLGRRSNDR